MDYLPSDLNVSVAPTGETGLVITLPVILPHRLESDKGRFLVQPLADACCHFQQEYEKKNGPGHCLKFMSCVLIYEHIYAQGRRRFIDHDNLELKHCQDVIESYFLWNDSSALCSAFQCSHREKSAGTRIWVLTHDQFPDWLESHPECWKGTMEPSLFSGLPPTEYSENLDSSDIH